MPSQLHAGIYVLHWVVFLRTGETSSTRSVSLTPFFLERLITNTWNIGLADTLQSETMLYGIETQIYFPPTMYSPGFENENKTKPDIVKKIEESDDGQTPEQAALSLYKGTYHTPSFPVSVTLSSIPTSRFSAPSSDYPFLSHIIPC